MMWTSIWMPSYRRTDFVMRAFTIWVHVLQITTVAGPVFLYMFLIQWSNAVYVSPHSSW